MAEDLNEHHLGDEYGEEEDEEDEETRLEKIREEWNPLLVKSASKGDLENVKKALEKGANILHEDKKKVNALLWASCKGYSDIVRYLLSFGAGQTYSIHHLSNMNITASQSNIRNSKNLTSEGEVNKNKVQ